MAPRSPIQPHSHRRLPSGAAFSLLELMVVIAIVAILLGLSVPALTGKQARDLTKAAYEIQGALELARSHAVANHTYTWVGFFEEDASKASAKPATSGVGRLVLSIVASRDGTSIFNEAAAETTGTTTPSVQALDSTRLVQLGKLIKLDNIHVCVPTGINSTTFNKRPGSQLETKDRIGLSESSSPLLFTFAYPLGGTAQYTFGIRPAPTSKSGLATPSGIVMFNPQGEAISDAGPVPGIAACKEIAIQTTHGTTPDTGVNVAAIDINGLTGLATIYRP